MSYRFQRPHHSLLLSLLAVVGTSCPVAVAQSAQPTATTQSASSALDSAATLIVEGRALEARDLLGELVAGRDTSLSAAESARAFELLAQAGRRIASADPVDLRLQRAEAAARRDDLAGAEASAREATRLATSGGSSAASSDRAETILRYIASRRAVVAPYAAGQITQAQSAFDAGRYGEAKQLASTVSGWGLELPVDQRAQLEELTGRIFNLELSSAGASAAEPQLGMMQPGVVRRNQQQPESDPSPAPSPTETAPASPPPIDLSELPPPPRSSGSQNNVPPPPNLDDLLSRPAPQPVPQPAAEPMDPVMADPAPQQPAPNEFVEFNATSQPAPQQFVPPQPTNTPIFTPPAQDRAPSMDPIGSARLFEAEQLLDEADRAFDSRRLNQAADLYERLASNYRDVLGGDDIARINRNLAEAKVQLGADFGAETGVLDDFTRTRDLARQQAEAEFNNHLSQGREALEQGDTGRARDMAVSARFTARAARSFLSESQLQNMLDRTDAFLAEVDLAEEAINRKDQIDRERELIDNTQRAQMERERDQQRKISAALERVRALQHEMKYDEALQVVDQILFLDPINPAGLVLKEVLYTTKIFSEYQQIQTDKKRSYTAQGIENEAAAIAPTDIVNYPSDWPAISIRRGVDAGSEPPEDRAVLAQLQDPTRRIPVTFADNALIDVVGFVEQITQLNVQVQWESLEEIGIERETPISLNLRNVTAQTLLDAVLERASAQTFGERADWAVRDGIVWISSDDDLRRNTSLELYDVRDLIIEVPDYNEAPDFDLNSVLQSQGGGQSPFQDQGNDDAFEFTPIEERVQEVVDLITNNVDFEGWRLNGGDTGDITPLARGGTLIIRNTPKNHREIRSLLAKLRQVRSMQINVETRFLIVAQSFFEQIGFDLDVYFNTDNNQVRFARSEGPTPDPTIQGGDFFNFSAGGIQRSVTGAQLDIDGDGQIDQQITQGVVNPRSWSPIGLGQNSFGLATALAPQEGITATILQNAPALGVAGQFLDDIQVDFLIQATQADTRSVTLTAPRLTFTNGQTANIYVATQTSFVSDLQPVVSDSAVGFDPTLDVISEGVRLLVEGTISGDRRYVTLNVDAAVAEVIDFATQAVTAVAGGQLVTSADTSSFIQLPQATVTRVQTTVTVPDQGTILLGGQRLVNESEVETGVPILSKVPILNRFFSNRIESKEEQTLLILLKPTILIQNENEERNFPGLLDSLDSGFGG